MFDDIIKNKPKYDIDILRKDISEFLKFFDFEPMDEITRNEIQKGINEYLNQFGLTGKVSFIIYKNNSYKEIHIKIKNHLLIYIRRT